MRRGINRIGGLGLAAGLALGLGGCDPLDCGEGTHRDGAQCLANDPVACGEGTVLRNGRCEVDPASLPDFGMALECEPGTSPSNGRCVPDPVFYGGCPDGDVPAPGPGCEALEPGEFCVTGTAVDVVTGCPPAAEAGLGAILIDPFAALGGAPPLGAVPLGPGGSFAIASDGSASRLVVIIDELDEMAPDVWTRSLTGVRNSAPIAGETYRLVAPATTVDDRSAWAEALGLDDGLLEPGYLVGRVMATGDDGAAAPAVGVSVETNRQGLTDCERGPCLRYFDDDPALSGFLPVGTTATGGSGAFIVINDGSLLQLDFDVSDADETYPTVAAGANPGSAFHMVLTPAR